jgi:hypothetical protein
MSLKSRSYTLAILSFLLISILVLPAGYSVGSVNGRAGAVQKPFRGMLSPSRRSGGSSDDLLSQLFLPERASVSAMMTQTGQSGIEATTRGIAEVRPAEFDGDVRHLKPVPSKPHEELELKEPQTTKTPPAGALQESGPNNTPLAAMPSPLQNFAGLSRTDAVTGGTAGAGTPPDINGDVGPNNYIEAVNDAYGIYSKTGTLQASFTENSLFSGGPTGTLCDTDSFGDPIVVYDQFADRWFLSNFAFKLSGGNQLPPTFQCFAVSKTSNPVSGGWWLYAVRIDTNAVGQPPTGTLGDYEKFGNWSDGCLYMTANGFSSAGAFVGIVFASFNKVAMESGAVLSGANSSLGFAANPSTPFALIPSNISGAKGLANVPPTGTPNYFVSESQTLFDYEVRKFTPGANCGTGGTLGAMTLVSQGNYSAPANIAQPSVATTLDSLGDRMMQKVQYRRVGAAESLWVVHTGRSSSTDRPQWAQINVTGGTVVGTPVQEQIYAPDTTINRWMASIAADHSGNVALGYSTGNGTSPNFPSIAYSGRLFGDAANQLPQTEVQLQAGGGSQNHTCGGSPCTRWGDYTAMSVDPNDDCTFWYTNEYYDTQPNGTAGNWHTRIGSFKFPSCSAPSAADSSITGRVVSADGSPLAGVTIRLDGGRSAETITNSNGNYRFSNLESGGFYSVSPGLTNYHFSPASRSFSLVGTVTDAEFTAVADTTIVANAIDTPEYFVRQQYLDFLGREPEADGFNYWSDQVNSCGGDADCLRERRIDVSAAFFMSQEFKDTGSFVYRLYRGALGRQLRYNEFSADRAQVVGGPSLEVSKTAFADAFVARAEFADKYQGKTTADAFVDALLQTMNDSAGVNLSSECAALITRYNEGGSMNASRALVVRQLIDNATFANAVYNHSFVTMQYMGFLRRTPDTEGLNFWVHVLDSQPDNYRGMVCSFITSAEYQRRFSSVVSHSNAECGR